MTPLKQQAAVGRRVFSNQDSSMDFSMEGESGESLASPPSPSRRTDGSRSRLFEDDDSDAFSFATLQDDDQRSGKTPMRGSFSGGVAQKLKLRPMNLSFDDEELEDEIDADTDRSSLSGRRRKRLEKLAESGRRVDSNVSHTPNRRAHAAANGNSDDDMHTSPYVSPNSYVTMDGRCVTSKNPFSPMLPTDATINSSGAMVAAAAAAGMDCKPPPSLPVSLERKRTSRLLQKRDTAKSPSTRYAAFTRDGYPERSGRYSFTGSPIREHHEENHCSANNMGATDKYMPSEFSPSMMTASKIRRLSTNEDVGYYNNYGRQSRLLVNTNSLKTSASHEEISPTDVCSFPTPPTPKKSKSPSSSPPETPFISRSGGRRAPRRRRTAYGDDTDMSGTGFPADQDEGTTASATTTYYSRFQSDFDIIGELGKGSFGTVYKVLSRLDGCMYAIKTTLHKAKGNADRDRMLKEVYALAALSDQAVPATFHIVRYHQAFLEDDRLYIQTELCSFNLAEEIAAGSVCLSDVRRYKLLREILLALEFIHRNSMCHLDIKPQNIFVKKDPPLDVYKLGDFGLVTKTSSKDVEEGDSKYMSMELLSGDHQDLTKSDIFSLGCTLYEICLGRELPTNGSEWQEIRQGRLHPLQENTPYEMEKIIREMLNPSFTNRPSAHDLLKRPQLMSKEQKALFQAKLALAQQQAKQYQKPPVPSAGGLIRRNTWSGGSIF